jgi:hypothetical protein
MIYLDLLKLFYISADCYAYTVVSHDIHGDHGAFVSKLANRHFGPVFPCGHSNRNPVLSTVSLIPFFLEMI